MISQVFVCVLIDEVSKFYKVPTETVLLNLIRQVESLTAARKGALNGNEPSDAIRVVNALLTQIDKVIRQLLPASRYQLFQGVNISR